MRLIYDEDDEGSNHNNDITIVGSEEGTAILTIVDSVVIIVLVFSVVGIEFVNDGGVVGCI